MAEQPVAGSEQATRFGDQNPQQIRSNNVKPLQNAKEAAIEGLKMETLALRDASAKLRADKEVVLEAVKMSGLSLHYASEDLRADKEVVLEAVTHFGRALCFASANLRADIDIVKKAVEVHGAALQFANEELQTDKEIVLKAVSQDGYALKYASDALRGDSEVALEAIRQNHYALNYVSQQLQADQDLVLLAARGVVGSQHFFFTADIQAIYARASFAQAKLSAIAVRGEEAPILSITLSHVRAQDKENRKNWEFRGEIFLMSGANFVCNVPDCSHVDDWGVERPHPILNDLAQKLVSDLPKYLEGTSAKRIFMNFKVDDDGTAVAVTPWDW
eukprot:CAMPEP_0206577434 /NCGR_PEP_ID=MMETSP0325_2-20121206/31358_1 /ASSEMBLY_ACC=CAM_ASM_000347 /TAXON_ID=2866 /ORGANISM="Crypthecodinium cohnii, Strain Seligo" /LENGTH=331 /DNA_ID=CAMNT_0054082867 /DNA_START=350 /DNA_END=1342 /DNA_ORIENTATION=-